MKFKLIISVLIAAAFLCGAAYGAFPVTLTDDAGYTVTITDEPKTIVSLSPASTEIIYAVGAGDRLIGNTDYCNYPEEAKNITKVGSFAVISVEKIVALNPDIIFANPINGKENVEQLKNLGFDVVIVEPDSIATVYSAIENVGKATGNEEKAAALVSGMKKDIAEISEKLKDAKTNPTVMHAMSTDPYYISGSKTFQDELITLAGGTNAFADVEGWAPVTLEKIIVANPDIILVDSGVNMGGSSGENLLQQSFYNEKRLASVNAVKNEQVCVMNADIFDRGGPRVVEALDSLVKITHPEIFGDDHDSGTSTASPGFGFAAVIIGLAAAVMIVRRG